VYPAHLANSNESSLSFVWKRHVEVLSAANYGWATLHQSMFTSGERLYFTLGPRVVYNNSWPLVGTGGVTNQIN
jgi:hypothetical protein